ncbi:DUF5677 domain-containing protein [Brevundimonas intermedia]|uniref:DUF5677 domain-containing protein n=1 Tax=Brevundimonas intermedia TaxID=74315 RepID=UPI0032094D37
MYDAPEDDPEIAAALMEEGLLSPIIDEWRIHYLAKHHEWFDLSRTLNKMAMRMYLAHWDMPGKKMLDLMPTASRVFSRAITNFEAAVILCERGSAIEAASLARSVNEASIWLGYMVEKPEDALVDLDADDLHNAVGRLKELRRVSVDTGDTPSVDFADVEIGKLTKELNGRKKPIWQDIAQKYGSSHAYMKFRIMSGFYSHLSTTSLKHHIQMTGDKTAFNILGPHSEQVPNSLYLACDSLADCGSAYAAIVNDGPLAQEFHDIRPTILNLRDRIQRPN